MIQTILHYMRCFVPVGWAIFCGLGWTLTVRIIRGMIIARPIPVDGYPSVEEEIRYVNDDTEVMRRHSRYRANVTWVIILCVGIPIFYLIPAILWK